MTMKMKKPNPDLVDKLVQANRILYDQGVVDGFGHVSVRHDSEPEVFLLSCNRAPGLVKRHDIVCYGYDGEARSESAERPYLERFIHGEIYRARPDALVTTLRVAPYYLFGLVNLAMAFPLPFDEAEEFSVLH
jgi:ribulose-5-phosphate 4-epimerase/fuculose-1-phosphate aldolase